MQETLHYDIVVIGSGPAGEKAAMQASKLKKQVALIEKLPRLGGASLHTGTVPSKSLRETVIHHALLRQQTHGIDINFKENITTITGATAKVKQLRGVTHTWKEALQDPDDANRVMYGLIAQEVETVIPELVHTDDLNDNYKSVSYEKIVPLLIETIKELEARITVLEG